MTPWPQVLEQLSGRTFPTHGDVVKEAQRLRGIPTSASALLNAWKRYGCQGTPSEALVGGLWEGEETLKNQGQNFNDTHPTSKIALSQSPRPSIRIPAPQGMVAVLGDIHFPIHDPKALDCVYLLLADLAEKGVLGAIVLPGDVVDMVWASRFVTEAERIRKGAFLVDELAAARPYLDALSYLAPCHTIIGNHEGKRWEELLNANPWLYAHPQINLENALDFPDGWTLHPWQARLRWDNVTVEHGDKLKGVGAKYGLANVMNNHQLQGESVHVYGHTHRLGTWRRTVYDEEGRPRTQLAASVGHLSDLRYHGYSNDSNWQQGLALLAPLGGGSWDCHLVEVRGGRCTYGGKIYGAP